MTDKQTNKKIWDSNKIWFLFKSEAYDEKQTLSLIEKRRPRQTVLLQRPNKITSDKDHILDIPVYDSMPENMPGVYSHQSIYPAYTEVYGWIVVQLAYTKVHQNILAELYIFERLKKR